MYQPWLRVALRTYAITRKAFTLSCPARCFSVTSGSSRLARDGARSGRWIRFEPRDSHKKPLAARSANSLAGYRTPLWAEVLCDSGDGGQLVAVLGQVAGRIPFHNPESVQ